MSFDLAKAKEAVLRGIPDFSPIFAPHLEKVQPSRGDWTQACCPFHEDNEPSFSFHNKRGCWICFAGCGKGDVFDFFGRLTGKGFADVLKDLAESANVRLPEPRQERPPIDEELVRTWHRNLLENHEVLRWLVEKRQLKEETLKRFEIGWDPKRQRNTIPIRDEKNRVMNVRLYNAKKTPKMLNYTDTERDIRYGSPARLFNLPALAAAPADAKVIICEGEWDCILLNQEGFLAVTGTGGCDAFRPEWRRHFKGRHVTLLYDTDIPGRAAVKNQVIPALGKAEAASVRDLRLPLKGNKTEKDVSDFFALDHTADDLQKLIEACPVHDFAVTVSAQDNGIVELKSFTEISNEKHVDKRVACEITVCGETSEEFHAVGKFRITHCPKVLSGGCQGCDAVQGWKELPRSSREYVGSCMTSDFGIDAMLRRAICPLGQKPTIEFGDRATVREFFANQRVRRRTEVKDRHGNLVQLLDGRKEELVEKRCYYLSPIPPRPISYRAEGWVKSHPKTQQITYLIEKMTPLEEDHESFQVEKNIDRIKRIREIGYKGILDQLTNHVTRIYDRDPILSSTLLTYCSPRWLPFNGDTIRGWLVTCVIGDAGTGKTQTATRVSDWVNLGDVFSGLTGSRTGLSYALVDHRQKGWQIKIGRYPANSRRLLIVDEAQTIPFQDMRTLSKAMEEGHMQVDRVRSQGYESQTRLLLIANPQGDAVMDSFGFGCEALRTIFTPTVIRRIDLCIFANASDLKNINVLNRTAVPAGELTLAPEDLRALFLWAWQLEANQIEWMPGAEETVLREAERVSGIFGYANEIPLVTRSDFRNKLARLSAALAVLYVSASPDFQTLRIYQNHVQIAAGIFEGTYNDENCQLDEFSSVSRDNAELLDYEDARDSFIVQESQTRGFSTVIEILRNNQEIRRDDLLEQADISRDDLSETVRWLKRFRMISSGSGGYSKKPRFNKFLRRIYRNVHT